MAETNDQTPDVTVLPDAESPSSAGDALRRRSRRQSLPQDDVPHSAVARAKPDRLERARELAIACARVADDDRGKDILLLDLRKATPLVDFFVLVTAASRRQTNAIAEDVDQEMKRRGERKLALEGSEEGRWVLIDYGDFVVHVLSEEARTFYSLEEIWGDADRVDWQDPAKPRPAAPTVE
jgi:ribosome-associated protein